MEDRESAYEMLQSRAATAPAEVAPRSPWGDAPVRRTDPWGGAATLPPVPRGPAPRAPRPRAEPASDGGGFLSDILSGGGGRRQSPAEALAKSVMRGVGSQIGGQVGRALVRGVLGSFLKR